MLVAQLSMPPRLSPTMTSLLLMNRRCRLISLRLAFFFLVLLMYEETASCPFRIEVDFRLRIAADRTFWLADNDCLGLLIVLLLCDERLGSFQLSSIRRWSGEQCQKPA